MCLSHGRSALESEMIDGFAVNATRAAQGMPTFVKGAKIAFLDFDLRKHRMQMNVQVLVSSVGEMEKIVKNEMDITANRIKMILNSGANVVFTSKGIDDSAMKYFIEAGAIAVRRVQPSDLRRLARATGGKVLSTLSNMEGEEAFDPANLGEAREVSEERVGDGEILYVKGCATKAACTILLRGANEYMLDEMDRSMHDSLMVVKRMLESNTITVGGGCVETALSIYLDNWYNDAWIQEQLAVAEFAEALLIIPKTLAVNAARMPLSCVETACIPQHRPAEEGQARLVQVDGTDLINGQVRNNFDAGVVEPAISKVKSDSLQDGSGNHNSSN